MPRALISMLLLLALPCSALAQEDFETGDEDFEANAGPEFGVRLGYGAGSGRLANDFDVEERIAGALPMGIDLGFRLSERWLVGGYGEYALGALSASTPSECQDCTFNWVHLALLLQYRVLALPHGDVWAGLGTGRHFFLGSINRIERDQGEPFLQKRSQTFSGPEYLRLEVGATHRPTEEIGLGPFTSLSLGTFDGGEETCFDARCSEEPLSASHGSTHLWFTTGIRVVFLP